MWPLNHSGMKTRRASVVGARRRQDSLCLLLFDALKGMSFGHLPGGVAAMHLASWLLVHGDHCSHPCMSYAWNSAACAGIKSFNPCNGV